MLNKRINEEIKDAKIEDILAQWKKYEYSTANKDFIAEKCCLCEQYCKDIPIRLAFIAMKGNIKLLLKTMHFPNICRRKKIDILNVPYVKTCEEQDNGYKVINIKLFLFLRRMHLKKSNPIKL